MPGPIEEMTKEMAEMHRPLNKLSQSELTASTLATSPSMLSMATAAHSIESISEGKDEALARGQRRSSNLRVRTLSDSLKSPDIYHSLERRSVGFDSVEIREYGIILGCNPAVSSGVPTTIDWESLSCSMSSLEDYESGRAPRRSVMLLKVTKSDREQLLKDGGYSSEELLVVQNEVESIRKSRESSATEKTDLQAMIAASRQKEAQNVKGKKRGGLLRKMFGWRR